MPPKREEDPDEILRRKFRARCNFRMLGRLVVENLGWMSEQVKKLDKLRRTTKSSDLRDILPMKGVALLTMEDKYLLTMNNTWRTGEEKEYLYKKLGSLKCFKHYPKNVRRYLSGVCYFKYFTPGRILSRKGQTTTTMNYIISGQIEVIDKVYEPYGKVWVDGVIGVLRPGEEYGQHELLHNKLRPRTYRNITPVELLCITKEDFNNVLEITIVRHWEDIKNAMARFTYFSTLTKEAILEGCMEAKLKTFALNEIILGDGRGSETFVYFILQGTCQMIDTILIEESKYLKKKIYKLYTPKENAMRVTIETIVSTKSGKNEEAERASKESNKTRFFEDLKFDDQVSVLLPSVTSITSKKADSEVGSVHIRRRYVCDIPDDVRVHFMQVCLMNAGGCFGWEDKMELRRVIALSEVKCLLLPKHWLWQNNPFNIWHKVKHYYEIKIPNKKQLYDTLVVDRKWNTYKQEVIDEINRDKRAVNWTRREDVPYTITVKENLDIREDYGF